MIELARHIEILLLDNDCVIIPGLGGFVTHHIPARRVDSECKFLPPYRTLGFNPKMMLNDGLLVQSYMQAYDTTYPAALRIVENKVEELKDALEQDGSFPLHGIGTLKQSVTGDYNFAPLEAGLLSPSLYGYSSFEMKTLAELEAETPKQTTVAAQPTVQVESPQEEQKAVVIRMNRHWITGIAAACVGALLILALTLPSSTGNKKLANLKPIIEWINQVNKQETVATVNVKPEAQPVMKKAEPKKEEVKDTLKVEAPNEEVKVEVPTEKVAPKPTSYYTIVLASSITLKNAEAFAKELADNGYTESSVLTKDGLNRVVYAQFESESQARIRLHELSKESDKFTEAWVLRVK